MRSTHRLPIVLVAICFALAGCDERGPTGPAAPLNAEFTLAPGQTVIIEESGIQVRLEGISADSRCPADVVCITAGDATVVVDVLSALSATVRHELHTLNRQPASHGDLTIHLVQLAPYPYSTQPIALSDYRATLRVTR